MEVWESEKSQLKISPLWSRRASTASISAFDGVDDRSDRIAKLILADHKRRIERLEDQVKDLRDLLAVK
jgi:hypothetical protein